MDEELLRERYELFRNRAAEISRDSELAKPLSDYFEGVAGFLVYITEIAGLVSDGKFRNLNMDELSLINKKLYEDVIGDNYEKSFGNPDFITGVFEEHGLPEEYGRYLCFLYSEIRGLIPYAIEERYEYLVIFGELFLEVYGMFLSAEQDKRNIDESELVDGTLQEVDVEDAGLLAVPEINDVKNALVSFENDYMDMILTDRIGEQLDYSRDFALGVIMDSNLNDLRYLYYYGEYVSDTELEMARFLNSLPEEDVIKIADTYTEGYRIGFVKDKKPLDKKTTVNIRFPIGFERVVKIAIANFEKMGLKPVIYRGATLSLNRNIHQKIGYQSTSPNRQFDYDHQDDRALFFDEDHAAARLMIMKKAYEDMKALANGHAGPAVIETFGENPFVPVSKKNVLKLDSNQQKTASGYAVKSGNLVNEYIIGEERSFTIIAFPVPEIGKDFERIFRETVKLNTLDYKLYEGIQQILIDTLDKADSVRVVGKDGNETNLTINLYKLDDPTSQTKFENCVADVNIPVGEVFTSPVLKGTNGLLHVKSVYLEGLLYKNLKVYLKDGCVEKYSCANFPAVADNEKYIKENVLFNHETLPIGEFAIGTNTTAYRMARDFGIEERLPILIGEKTGPHFALGDTCYSRAEEVKVYNPDGKEIISKENDYSRLRETNPEKAYFSCHTDITIPYDELGGIYANTPEGEIAIIADGRFVLAGCEELNKPLQ